jgi:predicted transcriptional regulator
MAQDETSGDLVSLTADIVSAFVSHNAVSAADLPGLISQVHAALRQTATGQAEPQAEAQKPAVPVRRSVTPDHIVCLEDGRPFKSLKRHLQTEHNMTPQEYRAKWGLPRDYPMVAPNYAQTRSEHARRIGLGRKPAPAPAPEPKRRGGRPRKA